MHGSSTSLSVTQVTLFVLLRTPRYGGRAARVFAVCDPCGRSTKLSTPRLLAVHGAEFAVQDLKRRLTCSKCGDRPREIRITYAVPSR